MKGNSYDNMTMATLELELKNLSAHIVKMQKEKVKLLGIISVRKQK